MAAKTEQVMIQLCDLILLKFVSMPPVPSDVHFNLYTLKMFSDEDHSNCIGSNYFTTARHSCAHLLALPVLCYCLPYVKP